MVALGTDRGHCGVSAREWGFDTREMIPTKIPSQGPTHPCARAG